MNNRPQVFYEFSGFRLDPSQRVLMRQGELVTLTPKGFEALLFFVRNSGRLLEKDELMKALWPESFVEEGNLSQHIFVLRKALGDDQNGNRFIQTIPRRGYRFVAPVKELTIASSAGVSERSRLSVDYWKQHSPFRGLQVFEPDDAWLFFGRDSEIDELISRLARSPVLVVIGNSGCGKSSLVRAGLVPALQARRSGARSQNGNRPSAPVDHGSWRVAIIRPSGAPFDYLAEVLPAQLAPELSLGEQAEFIADCRNKLPLEVDALRNAISALANAATAGSSHDRVLLVVDQFEELFTLTANREIRERYIDGLLAASRWDGSVPVHLLLVLRADFYSHCIEHPGLSRCLETNVYNVPRMTHAQLRQSIEKRLEIAGAMAEPGLIDALLEDIGSEPGDLALLEHALTQLWERCGGFGCTLTNSAYATVGRLRGALSAHADEVYGALREEQKPLAQKIFLELVHLGDGAPDTRRRVPKDSLLLLSSAEEVEALLGRLASSRLISISRESQQVFVEVSHEALIREWSTLREWIAQDREELRLRRRLAEGAREWDSLKKDSGALLQGARLAQGQEWLCRHPEASALVRDFVEASVIAIEEADRRELRKQKTSAKRLRWFASALAILLLLAVGAAWFAHRQKVLAEARTLAAQSEQMLTRDQGRALDLAIKGWNTARTGETYLALTKALPQTLSTLNHDGEIVDSLFSPDGERILTASYDHTARLWDAADGHLLITLGHADKVGSAAFSRDGGRIVTSSDDHMARIWNAVDGKLLATLKGHRDEVNQAEFSRDGQRIVTASNDHTARLWNATDGRLLAVLSGHTQEIWGVTFSPTGRLIATASYDHTARIWDGFNGRLLVTLQGHTDRLYDVEFSPDGQRVVTASLDHTARIWNVADGRLLATLRHDGDINHAQFSPDGQRIVTASRDQTARIWDTSDGRLLATLPHQGTVQYATFSPDGRLVVTGSYDKMARVWDAASGRLLATLQGHTGPVIDAEFSPDGRRIVTGSFDHTARVWNLAAGRLLIALEGHTDFVWSVDISPEGQRIVTASRDHTARLWDAADGRVLATLQGHSDSVWPATFSPDGQRIVTASWDHTARVWNAVGGRLQATLEGHTGQILHAAFSRDGERIVTASSDNTARVWSASNGRVLAILKGHTASVDYASFSPDGQHIVTASLDHTARVWSATDGHLVATLQGHRDAVYRALFSPDGQRIITTSIDHTARLWTLAGGRLIAVLQGHTDKVWGGEFSPDGQRVATTSSDHMVRLWSTTDGRLLAVFRGHTQTVTNVEFSSDGERIITSSFDHTARLWSTTDRHLLATLPGHSGEILTAKFFPDGRRFLTGSYDKTARIWEVLTLDDIAKMLAEPCPACLQQSGR